MSEEKIGIYPLDSVICCDALELLRGLPDQSVDLIATDPLYGIDYRAGHCDFSDQPRKMAKTFTVKDEFDPTWLTEAYRVLKDGAALYLCTRWDVAKQWADAIDATGLSVKQRIVWDKGHWGQGNLDYFGSQTEDILFAVKGDHRLLWDKRFGNVWRVGGQGNVWNENRKKYNITQKPILLMQRMIELSSDTGDLVVDPFMGSGTTCVAAKRRNRHFLGCDIDPEQVGFAVERLEQPYTVSMFAYAQIDPSVKESE